MNTIAPRTTTAHGSHGYGERPVVTALTSPRPRTMSNMVVSGFFVARRRPLVLAEIHFEGGQFSF
jgi:hypothetical protein